MTTDKPHNSLADLTKKSHHKHSYFLAGEIAVLTLSCIIFLGGLIAAVSVACIRRKRRHGHRPSARPMSHISAIPVELRMPKNSRGGIGNAPPRPLIFPMALPGEPPQTDSSDNTSETYTDGAEVAAIQQRVTSHGVTHGVRSSGLPTCQDCGKFRKPPGVPNTAPPHNPQNNGYRGPSRNSREHKGPGNKTRHPLEISLPSSTDSGIDGAEGQCTCCQSHNNNNQSDNRSVNRKKPFLTLRGIFNVSFKT